MEKEGRRQRNAFDADDEEKRCNTFENDDDDDVVVAWDGDGYGTI